MAEALRRLNEDEQNLRLYRIKRALDLSMKHQLLPKEDWTKPTEVIMSNECFAGSCSNYVHHKNQHESLYLQ